jgi:hypothetical protein
MTRTNRHLLYSLLWLFGFLLVVITASSFWDYSDAGINQFRSQIGSLILVLGLAAIFYSWARLDALGHGRTKGAAVMFAALWPFFNFFAHIAYLFYTRGLRIGFTAVLKFICFFLVSAIALFLLFKLVGLVLG